MSGPYPAPTARLRFREFRSEDFAAVHAYASNPDVTRYTSFGPNTEEETRGFLDRAAAAAGASPRTSWTFAIEHTESRALVGGCGLELAEPEGSAYSLGYVLAPEWWGQGYATEAAGALLRFGFEALGAERLFALVFVGNEASERVLVKAGLRYESEALHGIQKDGRWHAVRTYAMLRSAWQAGEK